MRCVSTALFLLSLAAPLAGQVCDANAFGPPTQDPLTITGTWVVGDGCTLDFGARHVILDGTLQVQSATILAARFTVNASGLIDGSPGAVGAGTLLIDVQAAGGHTGDLEVSGVIRHNDPSTPGTLDLRASGNIRVTGAGKLQAKGTTGQADGGSISLLAGGDILLDGALTTVDASSGGGDTTGGSVSVVGGGLVQVLRGVDAHGGAFDGGDILLQSNGADVEIADSLDVHATSDGWGGFVDVYAPAGSILHTGSVNANGGTGTIAWGGGDGGDVTFEAGGDVSLSGDVRAQGGIDGFGGFVEILAGGLVVQTAGTIFISDKSSGGSGGDLTIDAAEATISGTIDGDGDGNFGDGAFILVDPTDRLEIHGDILAGGNAGGAVECTCADGPIILDGTVAVDGVGSQATGGDIVLDAGTTVDLAGALLDADGANSGGQGGTITVTAAGDLTGDATTVIRARGNGNNGGTGGVLDLSGCQVLFPAGSLLRARGTTGGTIRITAGDLLTLSGEVRADGTSGGQVGLTTRLLDPWSPDLTGADIRPAPQVTHDYTLPPCLGLGFITVTTNSPVSLGSGQPARVEVRSTPNAGVLLLAAPFPSYRQLGALGTMQLDPARSTRLADPGFFGAPIPGSVTDATGLYVLESAVSPSWVGHTFYLEAYVEDPAARNGMFHQAPLATITFTP